MTTRKTPSTLQCARRASGLHHAILRALAGTHPYPPRGPQTTKARITLGRWECLTYDETGAVSGLSDKGREVLERLNPPRDAGEAARRERERLRG